MGPGAPGAAPSPSFGPTVSGTGRQSQGGNALNISKGVSLGFGQLSRRSPMAFAVVVVAGVAAVAFLGSSLLPRGRSRPKKKRRR